jgi:hypothetical protein
VGKWSAQCLGERVEQGANGLTPGQAAQTRDLVRMVFVGIFRAAIWKVKVQGAHQIKVDGM